MLRKYVLIARHHVWIPALTVALAVAAVLVYEQRVTPVYESVTTVRVLDASQGTLFTQGRVVPERAVAIEALYASSPVVKAEAERLLGPRAGEVTETRFAGVSTADAIRLRAFSTEKETARDASQAYAQAYVTTRRAAIVQPLTEQIQKARTQVDEVQRRITDLDTRISAISPRPTVDPATGRLFAPPERPEQKELASQRELAVARFNELSNTASDLDAEGANRQAVLEVVEDAELPTEPVRPSPKRDLVIAFALGLFVGTALVMLRERFDKRIVTLDQLEEAAPDVPVILSIPAYRRRRGRRRKGASLIALSSPEASATDAYRALRAALLVGDDGQPIRSLLLTGAMPQEGKTTTTVNLGVVLAMTGSSVLLIDADLRRPMLNESFSVADSEGLTGTISGRSSFEDAVRPYTLAVPGQLDILPAGQRGENPAESLQSEQVRELIGTAHQRYDFVLIDSPPILVATDALILASMVDGVVLVTRSGTTRADDLAHVVQLLRDLSAPIVSVVLNRDHGRGERPEPYYARRYGPGLRRRSGRHGLGRLRRLEPKTPRSVPAQRNGAKSLAGSRPERPGRTPTTWG